LNLVQKMSRNGIEYKPLLACHYHRFEFPIFPVTIGFTVLAVVVGTIKL